MTKQNQENGIRHLERNIIGARYLLEVYKIAYNVNAQVIANNKALAHLLANTYLRSLILTLCVIFSRSQSQDANKNLSLHKGLQNTFVAVNDSRPELTKILDSSISKLESLKLYKIRNKKIAHLDLEEISPSLAQSNPAEQA